MSILRRSSSADIRADLRSAAWRLDALTSDSVLTFHRCLFDLLHEVSAGKFALGVSPSLLIVCLVVLQC